MAHDMYRRQLRARVLIVAVSAGLALAMSPASAYAADLPAPTGIAPVTGNPLATGRLILTGVRTGRHDRYDRTVFDFTGGTPWYHVEYGTLVHQARDEVIPVAGAATSGGRMPQRSSSGRST